MRKVKKGNLLKDLSVQEVSLVGRGANAGAHVSLFKSDESVEELAKQSFNEVLSEMELSEQTNQLIESLWDFSSAVRSSAVSIIRDPGVAEKKAAIKESLNQFMVAMSGLIDGTDIIKGELDISPDETTELVEFFEKNKEDIINYNKNQNDEGGSTMSELEKLKKAMEDLKKQFEDAEAANVVLKDFEIISKMDDVTKAYYNSLDEDGRKVFLAKNEKEWAEEIKKSNVDDETFSAHGRIIRKSVVGEDVYEILKAQQAEIDTNKDIAKKEIEKRETAEFTKSAETLYKNLPGEPEAKGKVLKAVNDLPKENKEVLETMLKAGNEAMNKSKVFTEIGSELTVDEDSAEGKLQKMAEEHAKDNKVTYAKAYTTILKTEAGNKLYADSLDEKN